MSARILCGINAVIWLLIAGYGIANHPKKTVAFVTVLFLGVANLACAAIPEEGA